MKHLMLDLETMSSEPTAAIVSIGAVFFDETLGPTFKRNVSLESSQQWGLTISASTIDWWFTQSPEARAHLYDPTPIPLGNALSEFSEFFREYADLTDFTPAKSTYVWGNGATFDNVVIRNAYKQVGLIVPWGFRYDMCFRTLKTQFDPQGLLYKDPGLAHDALSDAVGQAEHAMRILESLKVSA